MRSPKILKDQDIILANSNLFCRSRGSNEILHFKKRLIINLIKLLLLVQDKLRDKSIPNLESQIESITKLATKKIKKDPML